MSADSGAPVAGCDLCGLLGAQASAAANPAIVWRDADLAVVLVEDADYPGFCRVVWQRHIKEMTDLDHTERERVMSVVWQVEAALRAVLQPDKVNVASFGNMTPHVHWHVIPRYRDDAHFPQPTWGAVQRASDAAALAARRERLPRLRADIIERLSA